MNENIPQLSTIKIRCNHEIATAVIYYPSPDVDDVYVLTAKHCLKGKKFDKEYVNTDIKLEEIFNQETSEFHSYNLTETDIVVVSDNDEDMALLILSKKNILPLTGKQFFCQVIDTDELVEDYQIRGYANFNDQEADRPFPMKFIEDIKSNRSKFTLKSENSLDTYYQQALENVEGLSGSGAYSILNGKTYFTGIVHTYEDGGVFLATKVLAYNKLIPYPRFSLINSIRPETDKDVLLSFEEMEKNEQTINSRTREKVGDFNVPRDNKALLQLLKEKNLVVVHGNPGVGKSALTKSAVADLKMSGDRTVLTFTAENLYCETLSEALIKARCKVSIEQILTSPLSNKYFLIWIESFEKLIESGSSGAFNELLQILKKNKNITIVITIRDYLLQKFKIDYYYELPGKMAYFQVDEFNDDEVELIVEKIPDLLPLMENSKIRHLLRTPYYLDKAVRIIPELLSEEHLDELQFKRLMWKHIVEDNQSRRGTVFYEICLKRSREMSLFTTYEGDDEITANLVRDNILQLDSMADENSFSPSHDILEDWALIRFIRHQKSTIPDPKDFLLSIESTPSMRRALRLWMEEFYIHDPEGSVHFVHQLLGDATLSDSWKDELLVVSLRSGHSKILLDSFKGKLLLDEGKMLKRIMFLLQTGCKRIDPVKRDFNYLLPLGSGWDYIIDFIQENILEIQKFANFEILYLNLIESWSKQLPVFNQSNLPAGAESAAHLLEDYIFRYQTNNSFGPSSRRSSKSVSRNLKLYFEILFKLTEVAPELVANLINASTNPITGNERWTNTAMLLKVRNYITDGVFSDQICRFFPDEVLKVAIADWAKKHRNRSSGSLSDMIIRHPEFNDFGLEKDLTYHYDFPSGYQTFFYWMFLYQAEKAMDFIIPFLNNAFEINQGIRTALGHEIELVEVTFEDESSNTFYGSNDYWSMYRGFSISDKVIVSLLMALEKALLDTDSKTVKGYLLRLIKETNNVAVLGVVSSVLQANPDLVDETSVSLLGIPLFFKWDSSRYTTDMVSKSVYNDDEFEKEERVKANNRIHRNKFYLGLIGFVADYMFHHREQNALLFKQVDKMWENLDERDLYFKKFLFDMDARKYDFKPFEQQGYENYVQIVPGYDDQVQQMVDSGKDFNYTRVNGAWARDAFDKKIMPNYNYETWKIGYEYILKLEGKPDLMVAPATMAALSLRDFSEQLQPKELEWCCETIIEFGEKKLVKNDIFSQAFDILESTSAIKGLIYILKNNISPDTEIKVKKLIFVLVLKGLDERERIVFLAGILHELSIHQPEFVLNCWYGLAEAIRIIKEKNVEQERRNKLYHQGEISREEYEVVKEDNWSEPLIICVVEGTIVKPEKINVELDLATFWHLDDLLRLTPWNASLPVHHQFVKDLLNLHLLFLRLPRANVLNYYESRFAFTFFYPRYLLNQSTSFSLPLFKELLDSILDGESSDEKKVTDKLLKFIYELVEEFIKAVDGEMQVENFWILWDFLKDWSIENLQGIFLPLFLFDTKWYEISEKKTYLEGRSLYYKGFIMSLGFNASNSAIKFISNVSFYNFMPDSISWIIPLLVSQNVADIDIELLENFIEKSFYKYGSKIKRNQQVLANFLFILDFIVKKSSPKAYMLREELLQYK